MKKINILVIIILLSSLIQVAISMHRRHLLFCLPTTTESSIRRNFLVDLIPRTLDKVNVNRSNVGFITYSNEIDRSVINIRVSDLSDFKNALVSIDNEMSRSNPSFNHTNPTSILKIIKASLISMGVSPTHTVNMVFGVYSHHLNTTEQMKLAQAFKSEQHLQIFPVALNDQTWQSLKGLGVDIYKMGPKTSQEISAKISLSNKKKRINFG